MRYECVRYDEVNYKCRILTDSNGEDLLIGNLQLHKALLPTDDKDPWEDNFANSEAESLYDCIFYFSEIADLEVSDEEMKRMLVNENPDLKEWFEIAE